MWLNLNKAISKKSTEGWSSYVEFKPWWSFFFFWQNILKIYIPKKRAHPHEQSLPAPGSRICFQAVWIHGFWTFHVNGIKPYLSSCDWFISLSIMSSRSIRGLAGVSTLFFCSGWVIFHGRERTHFGCLVSSRWTSWYIPRSTVAESYGNCMFDLLRKHRLFFWSSNILPTVSHQQCLKGLFSSHLCRHLCIFLILAIPVVSHCGFCCTFPW